MTDTATTESDSAHDPLIKQILQTFLPEFVTLFYPDIAERLDFATVEWIDKEVFTDPPGGRQRTADTVARVQTKTGEPEILLLHIEPQRKRSSAFPFRVFEYWFLLRRRYQIPVLPIALYLAPGAGGIVTERYTESLFGDTQLVFSYHAVGIPDLDANAYYDSDNPISSTFAALMKDKQTGDKVTRRLRIFGQESLRRMDASRRAYLIAFVEKYLKFNAREQADFEQRLQTPEGNQVQPIMTEYERRGVAQGVAQGKVEALRQNIVVVMETRFGAVATPEWERVQRIESVDELERLFRVALTAKDKSEILPAS